MCLWSYSSLNVATSRKMETRNHLLIILLILNLLFNQLLFQFSKESEQEISGGFFKNKYKNSYISATLTFLVPYWLLLFCLILIKSFKQKKYIDTCKKSNVLKDEGHTFCKERFSENSRVSLLPQAGRHQVTSEAEAETVPIRNPESNPNSATVNAQLYPTVPNCNPTLTHVMKKRSCNVRKKNPKCFIKLCL